MFYAVQIDLPPEGELETSGNGTAPTDAKMAEEQALRQRFLDNAGPQLAAPSGRRSVPATCPARSCWAPTSGRSSTITSCS